MAQHNLHPVLVTIPFQMFSQAKHMCFVHADVNAPTVQAFGHLTKHVTNEFIGFWLIHQQNIIDSTHVCILLPAQHTLQMS